MPDLVSHCEMLGYRFDRAFSIGALVSSFVLVEIAQGLLSCGNVADVFATRVGFADNVPLSPVPGK